MWREGRRRGEESRRSVGGPARKPIPPLPLSLAKLTKVFRSEGECEGRGEGKSFVCVHFRHDREARRRDDDREKAEEASPLRKLL